jgi:hypothetical protein
MLLLMLQRRKRFAFVLLGLAAAGLLRHRAVGLMPGGDSSCDKLLLKRPCKLPGHLHRKTVQLMSGSNRK